MKRMMMVSAGALVAVLAVASVTNTYSVQEADSGGQLLWSNSEAYLLLGIKRLGWRESYLHLPLHALLALTQQPTPRQQSKQSVVVFRLTSGGVERHVVDNMEFGIYTAVDGRVQGGDWKWTGSRFEQASVEEVRSAGTPPPEFSNINGWSKRSFLPTLTPPSGTKYEFVLSEQPARLLVVGQSMASFTIDFQRGNDSPQRIISVDEWPRRISAAEFNAFLQ